MAFNARPILFSGGLQWLNVDTDYWPRRLLHIPTMTSIERNDLEVYGDSRNPKYSILTYTWGRWAVTTPEPTPALPIKGTTWKIPAVKEEHFTVEAFQRIIHRMGEEGVEWAWVDIACIDQEDKPAKMKEIGNQASIFNQAEKAFVWLSHTPANVLKAAVTDIDEYGPMLSFAKMSSTNTHVALDRLQRAFDIIFNDPWFSSLWTLQEANLREDSFVLSAEGLLIPVEPKGHLLLAMFVNTCQNVYRDLEKLVLEFDERKFQKDRLKKDEERIHNRAKTIMERISQVGFHFLITNNPNVLYGMARYRKTSRSEDRVYAIMQVYNLRVGQSVRPNDDPSLDKLLDEFALDINRLCPILGRAFVHTSPPEYKRSWRIMQASKVPNCLLRYEQPNARSRIEMNSSLSVIASGRCCSLTDLLRLFEVWKDESDYLRFQLIPDDYIREVCRSPPGLNDKTASKVGTLWIRYSRKLYDELRWENVSVFHLGDVGGLVRNHIGLLLRPDEKTLKQRSQNLAFERLGLCIWIPRSKELQNRIDALSWKDVRLKLN